MRILYSILFFAGTILLICLAYLFLRKIDSHSKAWVLLAIFAGIAASIFLLILLLRDYIRRPPDREEK